MFEKIFGKKTKDTQDEKVCQLEIEISDLKEEIESLKVYVKNLHSTIAVVTHAQYEIGNDVGMIYKSLKQLTSDASVDDRLFGFAPVDDDEPYLN